MERVLACIPLVSRCRPLRASLLLAALVPLMFVFVPLSMDGVFSTYSTYHYARVRDEVATRLAEDPEEMVEYDQRCLSFLDEIASASDGHARYAAVAAYESYSRSETYVVGDWQAKRMNEVAVAFTHDVARLDDPAVYSFTSEFPALYLVLHWYSSIPTALWLLPTLCLAAGAVLDARRGRLLAQAPVTPACRAALLTAAGASLAVAFPLAAMLPGALAALAANGPGDLAYPVFFVQGDSVARLTLSEALLRSAVMQLAVGTLVGSLLALGVSAKSLVPVLLAAAFVASPLVPGYFDVAAAAPEAARLLPTTYLATARVAGVLDYVGYVDQLPVPGASEGLGLAVLIGWSLLACAASIALARLRACASFRSGRRRRSGACALEARDVSLAFGREEPLVEDASVTLAVGEILGLVAPNGTGKTTLMLHLAGLPRRGQSGTVLAAGATPLDVRAFRSAVLYVPGDGSLLQPNLSAAQNVRLAAAAWGRPGRGRVASTACGVDAWAGRRTNLLSQGMRQQTSLAAALATGARVLLLDEPMNALDPTHVRLDSALLRSFVARGGTVLMSSHLLTNVDELCDETACITGGRIDRFRLRGRPGGAAALYDELFPDETPATKRTYD